MRPILELLGASHVQRIVLGARNKEDRLSCPGLNLHGEGLLAVFSKTRLFPHLTQLSLANTPINDSDILHLHRLALSEVNLDQTGIGNEA